MNSLIIFRLILIVSSLMASIVCISLTPDRLNLINDNCFNETYDRKPWTLGQQYPVGMSIENLISLIEKVETKRPELSAQQLIVMILRRFHVDGLQMHGGINMITPMEMKHRRITDEILLPSGQSSIGNMDFPEETLTEDEKCALFYTISHTVNQTARHDEDIQHVYDRPIQMSRAPQKPKFNTPSQGMSAKKVVNTSTPIQSTFLPKTPNKSPVPQETVRQPQQFKAQESKQQDPKQTTDVEMKGTDDNKRADRVERVRRQELQPKRPIMSPLGANMMRLTRRPREKGVASFLNNKITAIAANRVLLGAAYGLLQPAPRTVRDLVKAIVKLPDGVIDRIPDGQLDPLIGVTLSDLLGIDAGSGLQVPSGDVLFGAAGEWNSSACQTRYKLKTNGTLATLAELRGGLDGWNIGRRLPSILQKNPTISLSQILRQYYSPKGIAGDSTVCQRGYGLTGELQNKVQKEAENYIRVWNGVFYEGSYADNQLTGFVAETWPSFTRFMNFAAQDKPSDERDFCNPPVGTDIKGAPLESSADVFFMMDNMPAQLDGFTEEIELITKVVQMLSLGRNGGSVSVLVNSQGTNNPNIVDENNQLLQTPLYALAYNTTSSQCASCSAAYFDNRQMSITDRPLVMELINKTLQDFELKKADLPGVPSKNFVWFDYGNLKPVPTDREGKRKYDDFKWRLRYEHRDVTLFMATLNKEDITDLLRRDEDWIQMGQGSDAAQSKGQDLVNKILQTPQTFQHNECRVKKSVDKVFEGFITPGYKQYWAMYPEYFIKSYTIYMRFKAEKSRIKVCFDRYLIPEREERRCDEAKEDGGEVTWTVKNPCQGKTFESCPALHFAIALSSQSGTQVQGGTNCTDRRCRSPDQIKWTFTHSGIACSGATPLSPTHWSFQMICVILFLTILCTNGKRVEYLV